MSIIAVENIPQKVSLKDIVKELKNPIRGPFEAHFAKVLNGIQPKTCYLQLSEELDPVQVVQNINNTHYRARGKYHAFIPDIVPDIPLGTSAKSKYKRLTLAMRKELRKAQKNADGRILQFTTDEILGELQLKYSGLHNLSLKYDHRLLQDISRVIYNRVKVLVENNSELEKSCFQATHAYRRAHPHTGDFQLVLSALHAIQEADGEPKQMLKVSDINTPPAAPQGIGLPVNAAKALSNQYSLKIQTKMTEHINKLDTTVNQLDNAEEVARKQVREELKKMLPFLNLIVNPVVTNMVVPPKVLFKMRIYGEPFLPNKETMVPFLRRFKPHRPERSMRMFNMLKVSVTQANYNPLMAMNGTVLNGAKLIIGPSDAVMYYGSSGYTGEGEAEGEGENKEESEDEPMDDDQGNWDEEM